MIEAVRSRFRRNPQRNLTKTAASMGISRQSVSHIIKEDLHLTSYKTKPREALTPRQIAMRVTKAKKLLHLVGQRNLAKVVFTDEKIFTLDESGKHPQVKFYVKKGHQKKNISASTREKTSHSPGIMVWGGVSKMGRTPLVFVEPGVKVDAVYYQRSILSELKQWCTISLGGTSCITLQLNWAPAHRAKSSKAWLRTNNISF